ncbi:hypothetical protein [Mesonia sp. K7]|uniref:hypothetical protein n=1 Tax=Mesonia sp. K7 TaxID=2218606 RepID=UPI000DAA1E0D|nr:hypothetical protein [Mesonia sp. K7]PZD76498.1 hypothetical protein DNG35_11810 [Mesonia sp. K7]
MTKTTKQNCIKKYAEYCDKAQYDEASFLEKLKLKFHLFFCKDCQTYVKRNTQLSQLFTQAKLNFLHPEEKMAIHSKMQNSISSETNTFEA